MKNRNFIKGKYAVAGVIEALLLVGLVAIILSIIQLVYIPQIMEQKEADHMDAVSNQFSFLKSVIDLQSMTKKDVPISSPITLGNRALPYFVTMGAYGQLKIVDDAGEIEINNSISIAPLTSIKYEAYNYYFPKPIPRQDYILEGGCIIVWQEDGEVARVEPAINVENVTDVNIYYDIPIIVEISGKNITAGSENCFIRTNYSIRSDSSWIGETNVSNIKISTEYPSAWENLTKDLLGNDVNIRRGSDHVEITKKTPGKTINLYYRRIYIYAQVSPGWIGATR